MSDVACEAACRTLLRRQEILPCNKGCDDTTKMAMLLDKMPDELRKDSADLKTQLHTGVVTGKAPWSIDTLIRVRHATVRYPLSTPRGITSVIGKGEPVLACVRARVWKFRINAHRIN